MTKTRSRIIALPASLFSLTIILPPFRRQHQHASQWLQTRLFQTTIVSVNVFPDGRATGIVLKYRLCRCRCKCKMCKCKINNLIQEETGTSIFLIFPQALLTPIPSTSACVPTKVVAISTDYMFKRVNEKKKFYHVRSQFLLISKSISWKCLST